MKNILIYYFQILLPFPLIYWSAVTDRTYLFIGLLIFYTIYRMFTDYFRLLNKNLISKKDFLKILIPFWRSKFFKELYFEN
jgi:hypothetical protein